MKKYILPTIGIISGGVLGYLYWYHIGCQSGSCAIKSSWFLSSIFGSIFGYLILDLIKEVINKRKKNINIK